MWRLARLAGMLVLPSVKLPPLLMLFVLANAARHPHPDSVCLLSLLQASPVAAVAALRTALAGPAPPTAAAWAAQGPRLGAILGRVEGNLR